MQGFLAKLYILDGHDISDHWYVIEIAIVIWVV